MNRESRRASLLTEIHATLANCQEYATVRTSTDATLTALWRRGLPYTDLVSDTGDQAQPLPAGRVLAVAWQDGEDCEFGQLRYVSPKTLGDDLDALALLAAALTDCASWLERYGHDWRAQLCAIQRGGDLGVVEFWPETNDVLPHRICTIAAVVMAEESETVSTENAPEYEHLRRLYFRLDQRAALNAHEASDEDFMTWARMIAPDLAGSRVEWPLSERAAFVQAAEQIRGQPFAYTVV